MRIKRRKQMRLDELIKYVRESGITKQAFLADVGRASVYFDEEENMSFGDYAYGEINIDRYFTVSTEEELTEETNIGEYGRLILVHRDSDKESLLYCDYVPTQTINLTREMHERKYNLETIGLITEKAELITVWSKDTGIPAEGVIECS